MTHKTPRRVQVGYIAGAHGVRGEVQVVRFGEGEEVLSIGSELRTHAHGKEMDLKIVGVRPGVKGRWLVALEGIDSRDAAEVLKGAELYVDAETLPPLEDGRHYWFELLGMEVITASGESLGVIKDILETGANDVYVIHGDRGEVLLPSTDEVVREIDTELKRMIVTPLEGMLPGEEV